MAAQPGPGIPPQKGARDRLIRLERAQPEWALGFEDECWWSRVTEPEQHAWSEPETPLKLHDKSTAVPAGEAKALACYGVWLPQEEGMLLRFVEGRPTSSMTEEYLDWVSAELAQTGKRALLLVWDNAPWHTSAHVRTWLRDHNRAVKRGEKRGVRLVVCRLPKRSPWLNPIEPKWLHGKRAVSEPATVLDEIELMARVYEHFACPPQPLLSTTLP